MKFSKTYSFQVVPPDKNSRCVLSRELTDITTNLVLDENNDKVLAKEDIDNIALFIDQFTKAIRPIILDTKNIVQELIREGDGSIVIQISPKSTQDEKVDNSNKVIERFKTKYCNPWSGKTCSFEHEVDFGKGNPTSDQIKVLKSAGFSAPAPAIVISNYFQNPTLPENKKSTARARQLFLTETDTKNQKKYLDSVSKEEFDLIRDYVEEDILHPSSIRKGRGFQAHIDAIEQWVAVYNECDDEKMASAVYEGLKLAIDDELLEDVNHHDSRWVQIHNILHDKQHVRNESPSSSLKHKGFDTKPSISPQLQKHFDQVVSYVIENILYPSEIEVYLYGKFQGRVNTMIKWIDIMETCFDNGDHCTAEAICVGLNDPVLNELTVIRSDLPEQSKNILNDFTKKDWNSLKKNKITVLPTIEEDKEIVSEIKSKSKIPPSSSSILDDKTLKDIYHMKLPPCEKLKTVVQKVKIAQAKKENDYDNSFSGRFNRVYQNSWLIWVSPFFIFGLIYAAVKAWCTSPVSAPVSLKSNGEDSRQNTHFSLKQKNKSKTPDQQENALDQEQKEVSEQKSPHITITR